MGPHEFVRTTEERHRIAVQTFWVFNDVSLLIVEPSVEGWEYIQGSA
jgi:hypothetical protein